MSFLSIDSQWQTLTQLLLHRKLVLLQKLKLIEKFFDAESFLSQRMTFREIFEFQFMESMKVMLICLIWNFIVASFTLAWLRMTFHPFSLPAEDNWRFIADGSIIFNHDSWLDFRANCRIFKQWLSNLSSGLGINNFSLSLLAPCRRRFFLKASGKCIDVHVSCGWILLKWVPRNLRSTAHEIVCSPPTKSLRFTTCQKYLKHNCFSLSFFLLSSESWACRANEKKYLKPEAQCIFIAFLYVVRRNFNGREKNVKLNDISNQDHDQQLSMKLFKLIFGWNWFMLKAWWRGG